MSGVDHSQTISEYHYFVGVACATHARYVEGLDADINVLIERSSPKNGRNRDLKQQRKSKERTQSRMNADAAMTGLFELRAKLNTEIILFSGLRDRYAHAYPTILENAVSIYHLPTAKHGDRDTFEPLTDAVLALKEGLNRFIQVGDALSDIHRIALQYVEYPTWCTKGGYRHRVRDGVVATCIHCPTVGARG